MDKKIRDKRRKNNDYLQELNSYDHYISLDWSLKNMTIGRMTKNMQKPKVIDVPSDIKELKLYLKNLRGKKILTIEETTSTHWLYVELLNIVDRIVVCDPYRNRLLSEGAKTDKIDATKLCLLLKNGLLKEIYHSSDELYNIRLLVSAYEDHVKAGVRLLNQKSSLYRSENKSHKKNNILEKNPIKEFIAKQLEEGITNYIEKKDNYHEEFRKLSKKNKTIQNLQSIPGIGLVSSVIIISKVIDASRFKSSNHYLSYCGLVKHDKFSGGKSYGKRNPRYSRLLKSVYKSASIRAIRYDNPIQQYYYYLVNDKNIGEEKARNSVARYISKVSLGVIKTGKKYVPYQDKNKILKSTAA